MFIAVVLHVSHRRVTFGPVVGVCVRTSLECLGKPPSLECRMFTGLDLFLKCWLTDFTG